MKPAIMLSHTFFDFNILRESASTKPQIPELLEAIQILTAVRHEAPHSYCSLYFNSLFSTARKVI